MKYSKIVFLILHYKNHVETKACVDSILQLDCPKEKGMIQIIDNGSNNGSYEILSELYHDNPYVRVETTSANLGFSGGNNFGWKVVNEQIGKPAFLIVCNSDLIFTQKDFCTKVKEIYERYPFDVLGPNILVQRREKFVPTSPGYPGATRLADIQTCLEVFRYRKRVLEEKPGKKMREIKLSFPSGYSALRYAWYMWRLWFYRMGTLRGRQEGQGGTLQGACLIYSEKYLDQHEKLFEPETFLYNEEEILFLRAKKEKLTLLYSPSVEVWHKEGKSSGIGLDDAKKKYLQYLKSRTESLEILQSYCRETNGMC